MPHSPQGQAANPFVGLLPGGASQTGLASLFGQGFPQLGAAPQGLGGSPAAGIPAIMQLFNLLAGARGGLPGQLPLQAQVPPGVSPPLAPPLPTAAQTPLALPGAPVPQAQAPIAAPGIAATPRQAPALPTAARSPQSLPRPNVPFRR